MEGLNEKLKLATNVHELMEPRAIQHILVNLEFTLSGTVLQ